MKRFKWFALAALVLLLVAGVVWRNGREVYLRYMSPPLPDGTRYTFLYPARMSVSMFQPRPNLWAITLDSYAATQPSPFKRLLVTFHLRAPDEQLSELINVGDKLNVEVSPPQTQGFNKANTRRHTANNYLGKVGILDARTKRYFRLSHLAGGTEHRERFQREDKIICQSFRLLPPGASVPSP